MADKNQTVMPRNNDIPLEACDQRRSTPEDAHRDIKDTLYIITQNHQLSNVKQ